MKLKLATNLLLLSGLANAIAAEVDTKTQIRGVVPAKSADVRKLQETYTSLKEQLQSASITADGYEQAFGDLFNFIENAICTIGTGLEDLNLQEDTQPAGGHDHSFSDTDDHTHTWTLNSDTTHSHDHRHSGFGFENCEMQCVGGFKLKCGDAQDFTAGQTAPGATSQDSTTSDVTVGGTISTETVSISGTTGSVGDHSHDLTDSNTEIEVDLGQIGTDAKAALMADCSNVPNVVPNVCDGSNPITVPARIQAENFCETSGAPVAIGTSFCGTGEDVLYQAGSITEYEIEVPAPYANLDITLTVSYLNVLAVPVPVNLYVDGVPFGAVSLIAPATAGPAVQAIPLTPSPFPSVGVYKVGLETTTTPVIINFVEIWFQILGQSPAETSGPC